MKRILRKNGILTHIFLNNSKAVSDKGMAIVRVFLLYGVDNTRQHTLALSPSRSHYLLTSAKILRRDTTIRIKKSTTTLNMKINKIYIQLFRNVCNENNATNIHFLMMFRKLRREYFYICTYW